MRLVWGTVTEVVASVDGLQELQVEVDDGSLARAINYPRLARKCGAGDRVLLNTTAMDLALGTGGKHFVVARVGEGSGVALDAPAGGHVMKLRYSPLQVDVLAVESQESPHHEVMRSAVGVDGMPVVCCGLHSQVPLVAAAVKQVDSNLKVVYCMTDTASLALPLSDVVRASIAEGLLDATISCGQAFGGQYEAVNLHSGILAARHVAHADVAIVGIGPGMIGTATPFGHGGVTQGEAMNAAGVLGGRPVAVLRLSFADERPRHRVLSHHTVTALMRIALVRAVVAVPSLPADYSEQVELALDGSRIFERHERADSSAGRTPAPDMRNVEVRSMGRGFADDPAFFAAAFAAGDVAARLALGEEWRVVKSRPSDHS